jgi:AcrR family transcriptional regulator
MTPVSHLELPAEPARAQRADAQRNRGRVLDAARARMAEDGIEAQMDDIAREAGVGVGTVYRHFPTKQDLLQALTDDRFTGLADAAREALEDPDPWNGFCSFMRYSARVMAEDRALSEAMDQRPEMCREAAGKAELLKATPKLIERAQAAGELREDIVPDDIPSLICGLGRATRASEGGFAMGWERHIEIILAGVRAPTAG